MADMFRGSLRAFFNCLLGTLGIIAGLVILFILVGIVYGVSEEETYGAGIELKPDAYGNRKRLAMDAPVILEIPIKGTIGIDNLTGEKIENILLKSREKKLKNDRVKAVLLVINSPGGGVNAGDQIYSSIKQYKELYNVPVYAYIDGLCASGGYYIACSADKIYASKISLVGSIGVLGWPPFFNISDLMKKIGIESMTLIAGKGKDAMNPFRPWKENEQEDYQNLINYFYGEFVDIVTKTRPIIGKQTLIDRYGANVFPAPQAHEDGFIDGAGFSRSDVLKALTKASGIPEDQKYQVISFEHQTFLEKFFESKSPFFTGKLHHIFDIPEKFSCQNGISFY